MAKTAYEEQLNAAATQLNTQLAEIFKIAFGDAAPDTSQDAQQILSAINKLNSEKNYAYNCDPLIAIMNMCSALTKLLIARNLLHAEDETEADYLIKDVLLSDEEVKSSTVNTDKLAANSSLFLRSLFCLGVAKSEDMEVADVVETVATMFPDIAGLQFSEEKLLEIVSHLDMAFETRTGKPPPPPRRDAKPSRLNYLPQWQGTSGPRVQIGGDIYENQMSIFLQLLPQVAHPEFKNIEINGIKEQLSKLFLKLKFDETETILTLYRMNLILWRLAQQPDVAAKLYNFDDFSLISYLPTIPFNVKDEDDPVLDEYNTKLFASATIRLVMDPEDVGKQIARAIDTNEIPMNIATTYIRILKDIENCEDDDLIAEFESLIKQEQIKLYFMLLKQSGMTQDENFIIEHAELIIPGAHSLGGTIAREKQITPEESNKLFLLALVMICQKVDPAKVEQNFYNIDFVEVSSSLGMMGGQGFSLPILNYFERKLLGTIGFDLGFTSLTRDVLEDSFFGLPYADHLNPVELNVLKNMNLVSQRLLEAGSPVPVGAALDVVKELRILYIQLFSGNMFDSEPTLLMQKLSEALDSISKLTAEEFKNIAGDDTTLSITDQFKLITTALIYVAASRTKNLPYQDLAKYSSASGFSIQQITDVVERLDQFLPGPSSRDLARV